MIEAFQPYNATAQQLEVLSLESALGSFLSSMRQHCGDIENFLICISVAARNYGVSERDVASRNMAAAPASRLRASNILSVSAATGIPRETVRRKTLKLCEQGLLERSGRKLYVTANFFSMAEAERSRLQGKLRSLGRVVQDNLKLA